MKRITRQWWALMRCTLQLQVISLWMQGHVLECLIMGDKTKSVHRCRLTAEQPETCHPITKTLLLAPVREIYTLELANIGSTKARRFRPDTPRLANTTPASNHALLVVQNPACYTPNNGHFVPGTASAWFPSTPRPRGKTNLSNVSASRYAFNTSHAINTRSPRKNTQLRNLDHENTKCSTNSAVNSKLDCHAWNLREGALSVTPTIPSTRAWNRQEDIPDIITLPLQNQQQYRPERRRRQVCQTRLII